MNKKAGVLMEKNFTKKELIIIKLKLEGNTIRDIADKSGIKEYQVRDILKRNYIKGEINKGLDEISEEANDLIKSYGMKAVQKLIKSMDDIDVTAQNLKAVEHILKLTGILKPEKQIIESHNINVNKNEFSDMTDEQLQAFIDSSKE